MPAVGLDHNRCRLRIAGIGRSAGSCPCAVSADLAPGLWHFHASPGICLSRQRPTPAGTMAVTKPPSSRTEPAIDILASAPRTVPAVRPTRLCPRPPIRTPTRPAIPRRRAGPRPQDGHRLDPPRLPRVVPNPCDDGGLQHTGWVQPVAPRLGISPTTQESIKSHFDNTHWGRPLMASSRRNNPLSPFCWGHSLRKTLSNDGPRPSTKSFPGAESQDAARRRFDSAHRRGAETSIESTGREPS